MRITHNTIRAHLRIVSRSEISTRNHALTPIFDLITKHLLVIMRSYEAITTALLLATPCFAWPPRLEDALQVMKREVAPLVARQTSSTSFDLSVTDVQGNTATTVTSTNAADSPMETGSNSTITSDGSSTGSDSGSSGNATSATGKSGATQTTSSVSINPQAPAGGISLITPNPQMTSYYKVQDWVTFAWNYTSLSVTPSAVDILASCALNHQTYTIALNQSVPTNGPQTVLWDTGAHQASPLLTETYTLIIHDAAQAVSATAQPGLLGTFNQFTFGMYVPLPGGKDLTGFKCVTCNGAMTSAERQTITAIFGMACLTVLSFTWFSGVAGLW